MGQSLGKDSEVKEISTEEDLVFGKELGRGAVGAVREAYWKSAGLKVAVKELSADVDHLTLQDFRQEVAVHSRVAHPNVVRVYAAGVNPPHCYLVIELCRGGSLQPILHDMTREMSWKIRVNLAIDIAKGLEYLHSNNVIHRDIKSDNILLTDQNLNKAVAKIADLGTSKISDQKQLFMTANVGTTQWMAPEVISGSAYSLSADMFSFGLFLWELAMRATPFDSMSLFAIPAFIEKGGRPDLPSANTCPAIFVRLMCKCWDQTASERPMASAALRKLGVVRAELLNQSKASLLLFDCVTTNDLTRLQVIIREAEERHFELRRRSVDIHASSSSVSLQQSDSASSISNAETAQLDINVRDEHGLTPLLACVMQGKLALLQPLTEAGADVNALTQNGKCALRLALENGNVYMLVELIRDGANIMWRKHFSRWAHDLSLDRCDAHGFRLDQFDDLEETFLAAALFHLRCDGTNLLARLVLSALRIAITARDTTISHLDVSNATEDQLTTSSNSPLSLRRHANAARLPPDLTNAAQSLFSCDDALLSRIATASICTDDDAVYRENLEVLVGKGYRAGSTVTSDGFSILTMRSYINHRDRRGRTALHALCVDTHEPQPPPAETVARRSSGSLPLSARLLGRKTSGSAIDRRAISISAKDLPKPTVPAPGVPAHKPTEPAPTPRDTIESPRSPSPHRARKPRRASSTVDVTDTDEANKSPNRSPSIRRSSEVQLNSSTRRSPLLKSPRRLGMSGDLVPSRRRNSFVPSAERVLARSNDSLASAASNLTGSPSVSRRTSALIDESNQLRLSDELELGQSDRQRRQQFRGEIFDALIELGGDASQLDFSHSTPLMYAIEAHDEDLALRLLQPHAYRHARPRDSFSLAYLVEQRNDYGETALLLAARAALARVVDTLLEFSPQPNVNVCDRRGLHALIYACRCETDNGVVAKLLDAGAKTNVTTPVMPDNLLGVLRFQQQQLSRSAEMPHTVRTPMQAQFSLTPLHCAVMAGNLNAVTVLLTHAPQLINVACDEGWFPLHMAIELGRQDIVFLLIQRGADPHLQVKGNVIVQPTPRKFAESTAPDTITWLDNAAPLAKMGSSPVRRNEGLRRGRASSGGANTVAHTKLSPNVLTRTNHSPLRQVSNTSLKLGGLRRNLRSAEFSSNQDSTSQRRPSFEDVVLARRSALLIRLAKTDVKTTRRLDIGGFNGGQMLMAGVVRSLQRDVWLEMAPRRGESREFMARAHRLFSELEHSGIARPLAFCVHPNTLVWPCFVDTLDKFIGLSVPDNSLVPDPIVARRLPLVARAGIVKNIADALKFLSEHKSAHPALAPCAVVITTSWQAKLTNVLTPPSGEDASANQSVLRNVVYAAPEQLNETQSCTSKGNVYSFAMIAFELLMNKWAFEGVSAMSIGARVLNGDRPDLNDCCEPLKELLTQCFAENPAKRPKANKLPSLVRQLIKPERRSMLALDELDDSNHEEVLLAMAQRRRIEASVYKVFTHATVGDAMAMDSTDDTSTSQTTTTTNTASLAEDTEEEETTCGGDDLDLDFDAARRDVALRATSATSGLQVSKSAPAQQRIKAKMLRKGSSLTRSRGRKSSGEQSKQAGGSLQGSSDLAARMRVSLDSVFALTSPRAPHSPRNMSASVSAALGRTSPAVRRQRQIAGDAADATPSPIKSRAADVFRLSGERPLTRSYERPIRRVIDSPRTNAAEPLETRTPSPSALKRSSGSGKRESRKPRRRSGSSSTHTRTSPHVARASHGKASPRDHLTMSPPRATGRSPSREAVGKSLRSAVEQSMNILAASPPRATVEVVDDKQQQHEKRRKRKKRVPKGDSPFTTTN